MKNPGRVIPPRILIQHDEGTGRKYFMVFLEFVILICAFLAGYYLNRQDTTACKKEVLSLQNELATLRNQFTSLSDQYATITKDYEALKHQLAVAPQVPSTDQEQ